MQFRVKELSLIGNELKQAGEIITALPEGTLPAENLEPLDAEAEALCAEYEVSNADRIKRMIEQNPSAGIANPEAFAAALTGAIRQLVAEGVLVPSTPAKKKTDALA